MAPLADGHTPQEIQNHLYHAFLNRATTDICIHVHSKDWDLAYDLHRVVLIQSGFFRSLFTRGFRESSFRPTSTAALDQPDVIDVHFDDPNITRAAFEICIARLYGGGPALHLEPSLVPSTSQPLTPNFLTPPQYASPPAGKHPATPRFLLSLIATSIYLSIPSITSYALSLILTSIGPSTVIRYLNFALAKGIGEAGPGDLPSVVGLEDVGRVVTGQSPPSIIGSTSLSVSRQADNDNGAEGTDSDDASSQKHSRGPNALERTFSSSTIMPISPEPEMHFDYGVVGNKIGEACASWLSRWAGDILPFEEAYHNARVQGVNPSAPPSSRPEAISSSGKQSRVTRPASNSTSAATPFNPAIAQVQNSTRRATISTSTAEPMTPRPTSPSKSHLLSPGSRPPAIWSRNGGLTARWVRGLISSDDFFINGGERERYDFATRVVEMRRRELKLASAIEAAEGEDELDEQEEAEWEKLFRTGFYYSHMSFDDLRQVQNDRSAITGKPFVALQILKTAHWNQAVFRSQIMSLPSVGSPRSSSPNNRGRNSESSPPASSTQSDIPSNANLLSTSDIVAQAPELSLDHENTYNGFFPVFGDGSQKVGGDITRQQIDGIAREAASSDDMPASDTRTHRRLDHTNFFGLTLNGRKIGKDFGTVKEDYGPAAKWTENEPCRFSVEFWGVETLKPSQRLYSNTFWCMGSLWNVYVQIVRKKGLQLGVYLQRQSPVDPVPPHSIPSVPGSTLSSPHPASVPLHHTDSLPTITHVERPTTPGTPGLPMTTPRARPWAIPHHAQSMSALRPSTPGTSVSPPRQAILPGTTPPSAGSAFSSTTFSPSVTSPAGPLTAHSTPPHSPYRDPRQSLKAYFSISCPSATGASSTKFSSAPDVFNVTQSWGWKSSKAEEWVDFDAASAEGEGGSSPSKSSSRTPRVECSLRATIVLGVL
ncbi:hypothetical protein FRC01_000930 [Tulasnella sp. 417]|nr:hypothetical protein FRC01_000930 [Tulasnella sp. 417]